MHFMMVSCSSTLSLNQAPAMSAFPIAFLDECKFAQVKPPRRGDMLADLFIKKTFEYPPAAVTDVQGKPIECGPISTRLVGVEPNYPEILHKPELQQVSVHAKDKSHLDAYPLLFESCITYQGQPYGCRNSTVFRVQIANPCDTTTVRSNRIPSTLSARITEVDEIDLRLAPTFWPWDEEFYVSGQAYVNLCQPLKHALYYAGTDIVADWAFVDPERGLLKIEPYVGVDLGVHQLTMRTTLALYDVSVVSTEDFEVQVYDCIPTVLTNGADIPDIVYKWGYIEKTYDASTMLNQYSQSPDCGYPIVFEAFYHSNRATDALTPIAEVREVQYYAEAGVFGFQKCGPSAMDDPECLETPYTKVIPIRLVATAGQSAPVFLDFDIIFKPDCSKDTIHFHDNEDFADITYYMMAPPKPTEIRPIYSQAIPECALSCRLSEQMVLWDPVSADTIVSQFSLGKGDLIIQSADHNKDDTRVILAVECTSVESQVTTTDGSPDRKDAVSFRV